MAHSGTHRHFHGLLLFVNTKIFFFELWHSISHTTISGTGWSAHKIGKLGIVYIGISTSISDGWSNTTIGMLPDGWKPSYEPTTPTALQDSRNNDVVARLFKDGSICIVGKGTSWRSGWVFAVVPYIIA